MTRLIKTFLKRKQAEPTLEEVIAFKTATMALQVRVEQIARQSGPLL
jgi:hypothetical protein